jgi:nicotinamide mononucleotide transporter
MPSLFDQIAGQFGQLSRLEIAAVTLAIAYLLLVIRQSIWCWLCAAISTAIYVYLFVVAKLYMESLLNAFYFAMAVYGWVAWQKGGERASSLPVSRWPMRIHLVALTSILAISMSCGFILQTYTDAALPYVDSLTTVAAMWATFLVARKVLENWWYWLAIDAASLIIYWTRDLQLTSLLFAFYLVMIPFGWLSWRRSMIANAQGDAPA